MGNVVPVGTDNILHDGVNILSDGTKVRVRLHDDEGGLVRVSIVNGAGPDAFPTWIKVGETKDVGGLKIEHQVTRGERA